MFIIALFCNSTAITKCLHVRFRSHTIFFSSPFTLSLSLLIAHTHSSLLFSCSIPFPSLFLSYPVPLSFSVSCSLSHTYTHTAAHRDLAECQACPDPVGETTEEMGSTDLSFCVCAAGFERDCKVCNAYLGESTVYNQKY